MGIHRGHLERIVMTFYLVYPLLLYICPVRGKDHSITLVLLNDRCQKVLNLLKKTLDYMESELDSLLLSKDFFKKIVIRSDIPHTFTDENGIEHQNIIEFLLSDKDIL